MALPTLDRYRQANPNDTRSDDELIPLLVDQISKQGNLDSYPDLAAYSEQQQKDFARRNAPGYGREFANAVSSGIDTAQGQLYSTAAQLGAATNSPELQQFGMQGYARNQQEAAQNTPTIGSYRDVTNVDDAIRYGLGVVGQNAPQMAGTVAATVGGALIGGPAGAALGFEGSTGAAVGSAALGLAASYTQTQNYADLVNQGAEDALATSLGVGAVSSLLETYTPLRLVSKFGLGGIVKDTGQSLLETQLNKVLSKVPEVARHIITEASADALRESGTEIAQELTAIAGEQYANRNNPNYEITAEQIRDRLINNGLGGFVLGGGAGAVAGGKASFGKNHSTPVTTAPEVSPSPASPGAEFTPAPEPVVAPGATLATNPIPESASTDTLTPEPPTDSSATLPRYNPQIDPFAGVNDTGYDTTSVTSPVDQHMMDNPPSSELVTQQTPLEVLPPQNNQIVTAPEVQAPIDIQATEIPNIIQPIKYQAAISGDTVGKLVDSLSEGVRQGRNLTQKMVAVYDSTTNRVNVLGLYHGDDRYRVTTGTSGDTTTSIANKLGIKEGTFRRYITDPTMKSDTATKARDAWERRKVKQSDTTLNALLDEKKSDGTPRYIPLRQITLSEPFNGSNVVFDSPEQFYKRYPAADVLSRASRERTVTVPILDEVTTDSEAVDTHDLGSDALVDTGADSSLDQIELADKGEIPEATILGQASDDLQGASIGHLAIEDSVNDDLPLSPNSQERVDESVPLETALSYTELEATRRFLQKQDPDLYERLSGAVPSKDRAKDRLWADSEEAIISSITKAVTAVRGMKNGDYTAGRDFAYKFYKDARKLIEFTQPIGTNYRDTSEEITVKYNSLLKGLADIGVDIAIVQQTPDSAIQFIQNQWGVSITSEQAQRFIALGLSDIKNPTQDNLHSLFHEIAHLAVADLPVWQRALVEDAVERMDGLKATVFSKTLDQRIKNGELPNSSMYKEVLAEHLAEIGVTQPEARTIAQKVIDFFTKLVAQSAMLYGQLRGKAFLPALNVRYAEIRFKEYLERVLSSPNDIDTLQGTDRWTAGKQVTFFKPLESGASVEAYDPATGNLTPQTVIDDTSLSALFNFDSATTPDLIEYTMPGNRGQGAVSKLIKELGLSDRYWSSGGDILARLSNTRSKTSGINALIGSIYTSAMARGTRIKLAGSPEELKLLREDPRGAASAIYDPETHTVLVDPVVPEGANSGLIEAYYAETIVHELVHGGSYRAIQLYEAWRKDSEYLDKDTSLTAEDKFQFREVIKSVSNLDKLFNWLLKAKLPGFSPDETDEANYAYAMTDLGEFAAAIGSDTSFLRKLEKVTLPKELQAPGRRTAFDAVIEWLGNIFSLKRESAAPAAIEALADVVYVQDRVDKLREGAVAPGTTARNEAVYREELSDEQIKFRMEQNFANANSVIDNYVTLFGDQAKAAKIDLREYLTKILGLRDPFTVRETIEQELGRLPRPIAVNPNISISSGDIKNPIVAKQLSYRIFRNLQAGYNRVAEKYAVNKNDQEKLQKRADKRKEQLVKVDEYLNDVLAQRDDVRSSLANSLTELRRELRAASVRSGEAGNFSKTLNKILRLDTQRSIPQEYIDSLRKVINEAPDNFILTDALTAASQLDIDWDSDSIETIQEKLEGAKGKLRAALNPVFGDDVLGNTLTAAVIAYGRENPIRMVGFALKVSAAGREKTEALTAIKNIVEGGRMTLEQVEKEIREARKVSTLVGKVKLQYRLAQSKFLKEERAVKLLSDRVNAAETGLPAFENMLSAKRRELGIRHSFEVFDGATVYHTPDKNLSPEEILKQAKPLKLTGEGVTTDIMKLLMDNLSWKNANKDSTSDIYFQVSDQIDKLTAWFQSDQTLKLASWKFTKFLEPLYNKVISSGYASARVAGTMLRNFESKKLEARTKSQKGFEVTSRLSEFKKIVDLPYDTIVSAFLNPAMRFVETNNQVINGASTEAESEQAVNRGLRQYLTSLPNIKEYITRPGAYDKFFAFLKANYEASSIVSKTGESWGVYVKDPRLQVLDPRTGKIKEAYRPALEQGFFTGHRTSRKVNEIVHLLKSQLSEGAPVWLKATEQGAAVLTDAERGVMFNPEVMQTFVAPFANDIGYSHFDAPSLHDDLPAFRAQPVFVQQAFLESGNNIAKFGQRLFELETGLATDEIANNPEYSTKLVDYQNEIIDKLSAKFGQMNLLTKESEQASKLGLEFVPHQAMDARLADDLPSEFIDYRVYDQTVMWGALAGVAAHSSFGRDLGYTTSKNEHNSGWAQAIQTTRDQINKELTPINLAEARARKADPAATKKQIDSAVDKLLGKGTSDRRDKLIVGLTDLEESEKELLGILKAPGGVSRDLKIGQEVIGTIAGSVVQTFRGSILQVAPLFDPFIKLRMSKEGAKQVANNWTTFGKGAFNSMTRAIGVGIIDADRWDQNLQKLSLMQDVAHLVGPRQIWADTGPNNSFESQRLLGLLRKGRSTLFNFNVRLNKGEDRTSVVFRPFAPFTSTTLTVNKSIVKSALTSTENWIKSGMDYFQNDRMATDFLDPNFKFTPESIEFSGTETKASFDEVKEQFLRMGTSFEWEVRRALTEASTGKEIDTVLSPDLVRSVAALALEQVSVESSPMTIPSWFHNNAFGRLAAPLITWPVGATNRMIGAIHNPKGEAEWAAVRSFMAAMLFGVVPAAIIVSLLMDEFDNDILRKQSNLADFVFDTDNPNFASSNATAFIERIARVGTFGLAGDVVNGIRVYGSDGDLRGLSFDQRVLFANTILTMMSSANTLIHQKGELTYASFWRPLGSALGGNAAMQNMQILNTFSDELMGVPLFGFEAKVTAKINATNYLRSAGRVLGMDVRTGTGSASLPTPTKPWIGEMVLAAYSNDRPGFAEAYAQALRTAKEEGKDDPEEYVKKAFSMYHPLRSVFATPPSASDYQKILGALDSDGKQDVSSAILFFNTYAESIGVKPYFGKVEKTTSSGRKALPSAY